MKQRYRIRLGGLIYIAIAVFIGMAALNTQTNLLFWVFGIMLGGLIVSGLLSGAMLRGVQVERSLPDHGTVDEPLAISYELRNRRWWLPVFGLTIEERRWSPRDALAGPPLAWLLHVGPRRQVRAAAVAWPSRRGTLRLDRIAVTTSFPFGIIRKSSIVSQPAETPIYPRIHRLRGDLFHAMGVGESALRRRGDRAGGDEEFYGVREYRYGDSIRRIDWKRSAHVGELVSREMTQPTPFRLMVLLDLRPRPQRSAEEVEQAISLAASLVCAVVSEGTEVGLAVEGAGAPFLPPRRSRWHRTQLLHALAAIDLNAEQAVRHSPLRISGQWIVVHAGLADLSIGPGGAVHLTARELPRYLAPEEQGAESGPAGAVLHEGLSSRRMREAPAWT
jgi:uncharacterized protein (DUF58 family)